MANIPHVCRRRKCQKRKVLPRRIEAYIRPPKCTCGSEYRVDVYRLGHPEKSIGKTCRCDWLHYSHRLASKGCKYWEDKYLRRVLADTSNTIGTNAPF